MDEWKRNMQRRQAIQNAFYLVMFGVIGAVVILSAVWLLGHAGGRW